MKLKDLANEDNFSIIEEYIKLSRRIEAEGIRDLNNIELSRNVYDKEIDLRPKINNILEKIPQKEKIISLKNNGRINYYETAVNLKEYLKTVEKNEDKLILDINNFHPWIQESSLEEFNNGNYTESVFKAGLQIKHELEVLSNKKEHNNKEQQLFNEIFGDKSIVTWQNLNDDDIKNRRRALRSLSEGFFAGIRNDLAHKIEIKLNYQEAAEWLSVASRICWWLETADYHINTGG